MLSSCHGRFAVVFVGCFLWFLISLVSVRIGHFGEVSFLFVLRGGDRCFWRKRSLKMPFITRRRILMSNAVVALFSASIFRLFLLVSLYPPLLFCCCFVLLWCFCCCLPVSRAKYITFFF